MQTATEQPDISWWPDQSCEQFKQHIVVPLNADGSKAYPSEMYNRLAFWRCNASYEIGQHGFYQDQYETLQSRQSSPTLTDLSGNELSLTYAAPLFIVLTLVVICWKLAHQRRIKSFQYHQLDRLATHYLTFNRDEVAGVCSAIKEELDDSQHPIPYIFGIRQKYHQTLEETYTTAKSVQQAVVEYLSPHEQTRLEGARVDLELRKRSEQLKQDLNAEVPRFLREQLRRQHQFEQAKWVSAQQEITSLRSVIVASLAELRENPSLQTKLGYVVDSMQSQIEFMTKMRDTGLLSDDDWSRNWDVIMNKVSEQDAQRRTRSVFNSN